MENLLSNEYQEYLKREEILWHQKSQIQWLITPDLNTRFFHLSTIIRRCSNLIDFLKTNQGTWISDRTEIGSNFQSFFIELFSLTSPSFPHELQQLIPTSITEEDNILLCIIPTDDEIKQTVFSMGSNKSPSPNGMSILFYKTYWYIIKKEVIESIKIFFESGKLLQELNTTFISLIPKSESPTSVSHYRPISLCNVSYKIISKIMASHLKQVLPKLISPWQSSFVPVRLIQDNTILAQEAIHTMKFKKGKVGIMALKNDMEKAFDKMEWSFLLGILRCFGFKDSWINLIVNTYQLPHFQFCSMGSLSESSSLNEAFDKGILSHPFFSYWALKSFLVYSIKQS